MDEAIIETHQREVRGDNLARKDVIRAAKRLAKHDLPRSLPEISCLWLQIGAAIALYYYLGGILTFLVVLVFVGARQYALLVLLHDSQHSLLAKDRWLNDFLAQWFIAAPCGTISENSRKSHLDHHQHLGTVERDPAFHIYCPDEPWPKHQIWDFVRFYLHRVVGSKFRSLFSRGGAKSGAQPGAQSIVRTVLSVGQFLFPVIVCQSILFAVLVLIFGWYGWFLIWFLPLLTLVVLFDDFRQFCEHSNVSEGSFSADDILISYQSNPIELFFFAPMHMNYHAEHHMFPFVPHRHLPELRKLIKRCPDMSAKIQWRNSYVGHFRRYLRARAGSRRRIVTKLGSGT